MPDKLIVLVANASEARLFDAEHLRIEDMHLVGEFSHPDSRKKVIDLVCDREGVSEAPNRGGATNSYEGKHNPKDVEAEHFVLELVKKVYEYCYSRQKNRLLVVMPSHLYNSFTHHWHHHTPAVEHLGKDYTKHTLKELSKILREHLFELKK